MHKAISMGKLKMNRCFVLAVAITLSACSSPSDTVVPSSIDKMDSIKPQLEKLAPEQRELFDKYILRHTPSKTRYFEAIPEGITISKAIEAQRAFKLIEDTAIKSAKNKLESYLTDPNSIQYKKVFARYSKTKTGSDVFEVCLEYNAKNKMGGYVGFEKEMCYIGMADNQCVLADFKVTLEDELKKAGITETETKNSYSNQMGAINKLFVSVRCSEE